MDYNKKLKKMQDSDKREQEEQGLEVLQDFKKDGTLYPWKEKKKRSLLLRNSYIRLSKRYTYKHLKRALTDKEKEQHNYYKHKSLRVNDCSNYLVFRKTENGKLKLYEANFCQTRLCPLCALRREMKARAQLSKVLGSIEKTQPELNYIFLTLTVENIKADKLKDTIDNMQIAFNRLFKYKKVNNEVVGYYRALEIGYDNDPIITQQKFDKAIKYYTDRNLKVGDINPNYRHFHPHFHVMIAVNPDYYVGFDVEKKKPIFKIQQSEWCDYWVRAMQINYRPIVDVRTIKSYKKGKKGGILETAKYIVKDSDYLFEHDFDMTDEVVETLDHVLHNRRLIGWGKLFKDVHKKLNLTEDITADVVIDGEEDSEVVDSSLIRYLWNKKHLNYIRVESDRETDHIYIRFNRKKIKRE